MHSSHSYDALENECKTVDELSRELLSTCDYAGFLSQPPFSINDERLSTIKTKLGWTAISFGAQLQDDEEFRATFHISVALYAGIRRLFNQKFTVDDLCLIIPYVPDAEADELLKAGDTFVQMFLKDPEMLKVPGAFEDLRVTLKAMLEAQLRYNSGCGASVAKATNN